MPNDLRQAIDDARKLARDIPSQSLLGRAIYHSLTEAERAYRCNDGEAVQHELDAINQLLSQS